MLGEAVCTRRRSWLRASALQAPGRGNRPALTQVSRDLLACARRRSRSCGTPSGIQHHRQDGRRPVNQLLRWTRAGPNQLCGGVFSARSYFIVLFGNHNCRNSFDDCSKNNFAPSKAVLTPGQPAAPVMAGDVRLAIRIPSRRFWRWCRWELPSASSSPNHRCMVVGTGFRDGHLRRFPGIPHPGHGRRRGATGLDRRNSFPCELSAQEPLAEP